LGALIDLPLLIHPVYSNCHYSLPYIRNNVTWPPYNFPLVQISCLFTHSGSCSGSPLPTK
jgi:hypothetical protein